MITKPLRPVPDDLAETLAKGEGVKAAMRHYRCGPRVIARWLAEAGLNRKDYRKSSSWNRQCPTDFAEMAEQMNRLQLQRHYKVGDPVLSRWLRDTGVKTATHTKPKRPVPDDFAHLAPTMYQSELKAHYSTSCDVIKRWAAESGVTVKAFKPAQPTKIAARPYHCSTRTDGGRGWNFSHTKTYTAHDLAADDLRRDGWAVYHSDENGRADPKGKFWRVGNVVCDGDELLARAERVRRKAAA